MQTNMKFRLNKQINKQHDIRCDIDRTPMLQDEGLVTLNGYLKLESTHYFRASLCLRVQ